MDAVTMRVGTRVCFLADGEYCGGQWTGAYGGCGEYVIRCDECRGFHWINPEDFLPVPDLEPEDFASPKLTYRERLQIEEDNEQAEYLVRQARAKPPRSRYAVLAFPLVVAGLGACLVGGVHIAHGKYFLGGIGLLLFVGAFFLASRLERGV